MALMIFGALLIAGGFASVIYGNFMNNDLSSQIAYYSSGGDPGNIWIFFGVVAIVIGIVMVVCGDKRMKADKWIERETGGTYLSRSQRNMVREYQKQLNNGVITKEEFRAKKEKILKGPCWYMNDQLIKKSFVFLLCLTVLFSLCACTLSSSDPTHPNAMNTEEKLSDSCDYILCRGTDVSGNTYELVANQEETALGYKISVGIIKDNEWFCPLSSNFPFLKGGLFPMEDGMALTRVTSAKLVSSYIYFIDSGAFAMVYATISPMRKTMVIYNCNTMQSYTYYDDDYTWLYLRSDVRFKNDSTGSFDVESYGRILTDDDKMLMYRDVSDPYDRSSPKTYDWFVLDTKTMGMNKIVANSKLHPECVLAEGLIFASDHCFYNLNMMKTVDLSHYDIDDESLYFENGECTFVAENDLGTEFEITIDNSGQVLSEVKQ